MTDLEALETNAKQLYARSGEPSRSEHREITAYMRAKTITTEQLVDAKSAVRRVAGWQYVERYLGQPPSWVDRCLDGVLRAAFRGAGFYVEQSSLSTTPSSSETVVLPTSGIKPSPKILPNFS